MADAHDDGNGHADGHGHDADAAHAEPLGEPALTAWGAALLGAGIASLLAIALFVATQA